MLIGGLKIRMPNFFVWYAYVLMNFKLCSLQAVKEFQMVDGKTLNGANAFTTPGVTICVPSPLRNQPDVIGFSA